MVEETLQYMRWQTFANHGTRVSYISDKATTAVAGYSGYLWSDGGIRKPPTDRGR